jgi:uncharacterized membrane protein
MTRRRVLHDARFLIFISALVGCGPDPAKQALLEQLVTTQSAIAAGGVTQVTLREREIALRTAAEFANGRLNGSQHQAVADAIDAISQTRKEWSSEYAQDLIAAGSNVVGPLLDTCATRLDAAIAWLR